MNRLQAGDWVIYRREKHSTRPGRRARNIDPAPHGELYTYEVDKFWKVLEVDSSRVVMVTRRGKRHIVSAADPRLRKPSWWERVLYSRRFPDVPAMN